MRSRFSRLTGIIMAIGAVMGLALSLYGLFGLWMGKAETSRMLTELVALGGRTVDATGSTLDVVSTSLVQASTNLALMRAILDDTAETIGESTALVDTTADLLGSDMPAFIDNTKTSLTSVQSTARLIDDLLGTITRIPLLGPFMGQRYAPEVPLAASVADVSLALDPLNETFTGLQREMKVASASLDTVQGEIDALSGQIGDIDKSLNEATGVVGEYQLILADLNGRFERLETRLPVLIDTIYLALTLALIWVGVSQTAALLQAIEILQAKRVD